MATDQEIASKAVARRVIFDAIYPFLSQYEAVCAQANDCTREKCAHNKVHSPLGIPSKPEEDDLRDITSIPEKFRLGFGAFAAEITCVFDREGFSCDHKEHTCLLQARKPDKPKGEGFERKVIK